MIYLQIFQLQLLFIGRQQIY